PRPRRQGRSRGGGTRGSARLAEGAGVRAGAGLPGGEPGLPGRARRPLGERRPDRDLDLTPFEARAAAPKKQAELRGSPAAVSPELQLRPFLEIAKPEFSGDHDDFAK